MDKGYAWVVMMATCLLQILYSCLLTSFGIFLVDITETTAYSTGRIAWIGAIGATFCGVSGAFTGNFIDRYGCRKVVIVGSLMISTGYLLSAFVRNVNIQYFSLGILAGIGFNCYAVSSHVAASQWFSKRKSLALSIVMFGMSFGIFIWGPIARFLSFTFAWRGAMFVIAGIQLNGLVIALLLRPPPKEKKPIEEQVKKELEVQEKKNITFKLCDFTLCKDWLFMVYCVANFCLLFGHVLPLILLPTKAETLKISKTKGAALVSTLGACSCIGRPIVGYCADKPWFNRRLLFASSSLVGGLLSAFSTLLNTFVLLMVYSSLIGFFSGI
ncbi:DgyrCDS13287 [Dimorphilus gyrociliatus]|uniref:DgyrCDS13287 n=1 Tax=Dimorphilus gyrociliatus TaxID=2664684 RepID=A0A7I8WA69_9ANNE|nr:DgyrCDS13287 [Dimorphilus gyrociliatus]